MQALIAVAILALAGAHLGADETPCPALDPGDLYPWQSRERMSGDQWADMLIDIDPSGKPTGCRVRKSNVSRDMHFFMCRALTAQGEFDPVIRDGVPVAGTIERSFLLAVSQRKRADERARKRYFAENPHERPSCYPR